MRNNGRSNRYQKDRHNDYYRRDQLVLNPSGAIFMCNNRTQKECFNSRIFGLPASREFFVKQVKEGMYLFLFNVDDRKMCGVFKAASDGGMDIMPKAFSSSGSSYPAQVQVTIECMYDPLTEMEFKPAILEKYFIDGKFNFDLNSNQVRRLLVLFEAKKNSRVLQPIADRLDLRSSINPPLNLPYSNPQHDIMSKTNTLGQTTLKIQNTEPNPNSEGSERLINSDMNFQTSGNLNPPQQLDQNAITASTRNTYPTHNGYSYPNDPAQQGVLNSSSLCLSQQQTYECQTDPYAGNFYTQRMVSCLAYNPILQQQPQSSLLCVNSNSQQFTLSGYNSLNLYSSQPAQIHASYPSYPGDIAIGVNMPSNSYKGTHLQGQFYSGNPQNDCNSDKYQDVGHVSAIKMGQSENPGMASGFYPAKLKSELHENSKTDVDPKLHQDHSPNPNPNPNSNPNPTLYSDLYSDVEKRKSVFLRLAKNPRISPQEKEKHSRRAGGNRSINQLPGSLVQQSRHENGIHITDKPVSNKNIAPDSELVHIHEKIDRTEGGPDTADVVDEIDVYPTADMVPDEIPISLVNFKRRSSGNTLNTPLGGEQKKRRFVRPSLELGGEDDDLHALKDQEHKLAVFSDKQSKEHSSVGNKSVNNGENVVITDTINVEGQVDDANSEILDRSHCSFCIKCQSKGNDSYFKAESLGSSTGECRDENNEVLVMSEIESPQQKNDLEESRGALCNTEISLERPAETVTVDLKSASGRTECACSQKILNTFPGYEGLDTSQLKQESLNKDSSGSSKGHMESLVLGEKTEEKKPVPSPEPVFSEPKAECTDALEIAPDNLTSVSVYKQEINLAEEFSHKEMSDPVEEFIAL